MCCLHSVCLAQATHDHGDTDKDGVVDDTDLLAVLLNFGQGC
jgi:hypothetical protein